MPNSFFSDLHELEDSFQPKRSRAVFLSESFERLGYDKFMRVRDCGSYLMFAHEFDVKSGTIDPVGLLYRANFCKDRLCPLCSWRRSLKYFGQISQIADLITSNYVFIFLTLTVPNCTAENLNDTIERMGRGFRKMIRRKKVKSVLNGFIKSLEITYNVKNDTFHPHFHIILAMDKNYESGCKYISKDLWRKYWRESYYEKLFLEKYPSAPIIIDVKKCYSKESSFSSSDAIKEAAKYSVKSDDYLFISDIERTDHLVSIFNHTLYHKRMIQFGGCFLNAHKLLGLDDVEDDSADLVQVGKRFNPLVHHYIQCFGWSYGGYKLVRQYIDEPRNNTPSGDC